MILRPYKAEDAIEILSTKPRQPMLELDNITKEFAKLKETRGPALTGTVDGRVIGCGGLEILWPGFAEGWCLFSERIEIYGMATAKTVKRVLWKWIKEYKLVRIQAPLRADFPLGLRFTEWLGFEYEATLHKYHPDRCDALIYSIVEK